MKTDAVLSAYARAVRELPALLESWESVAADLQSHYADALEELLARRAGVYQRAQKSHDFATLSRIVVLDTTLLEVSDGLHRLMDLNVKDLRPWMIVPLLVGLEDEQV